MPEIPDNDPGDDPNNWRTCPACGGDGYSDEDGSDCPRCEGKGGIADGVMVGEHEPWVPYLSDRADGVRGHYAICRWNPRGYREAWNLRSHSWASCSDEVLTLEQAQKLLAGLTLPSGVAIPVAPSREHAELMLLAAHDLESWMKSYHHDAATESTVQKLKAAALGVKGLDRG